MVWQVKPKDESKKDGFVESAAAREVSPGRPRLVQFAPIPEKKPRRLREEERHDAEMIARLQPTQIHLIH